MRHLLPGSAAFSLALLLSVPFGAVAQSDGRNETQGGNATDRPAVKAVRHWSLGTVTRIVVESTGEFRFKMDRLQNPDRLFFDLIGTRPDLGQGDNRGIAVIEVGDQFVRQIRVAETQKLVTRVVLDLAAPVEVTTSQLANPDRLVIELRAPETPRARLQRERAERRRIASLPRQLSQPAPRVARLDFSAVQARRQAERQTLAVVLPDAPSPFDPNARFWRYSYRSLDPLRTASWAWPPRMPYTPPARHAPAVLAKSIPPPAPVVSVVPVAPRESSASTSEPEEIGTPAKHTAPEDTMIRVLGLKLGRVVIDPGHGGNDAGTSSPGGLHEKDVVLDVSRRLGALIEERLGSEVVYTRTDDRFVALGRRTALANEKKADLFLSVHVNSSHMRAVGGVETYYLSFTASKTSLETAMRENAGADRNIGELQDLLKKIALKDKVEESREFASCVQTSLVALSPRAVRAANDRGVKRAPFVVLIGASMPSILAEIGFISNSQDESQMRRPEYRQKIAEALYQGVANYANTLSHFNAGGGKLAKTGGGSGSTSQ